MHRFIILDWWIPKVCKLVSCLLLMSVILQAFHFEGAVVKEGSDCINNLIFLFLTGSTSKLIWWWYVMWIVAMRKKIFVWEIFAAGTLLTNQVDFFASTWLLFTCSLWVFFPFLYIEYYHFWSSQKVKKRKAFRFQTLVTWEKEKGGIFSYKQLMHAFTHENTICVYYLITTTYYSCYAWYLIHTYIIGYVIL